MIKIVKGSQIEYVLEDIMLSNVITLRPMLQSIKFLKQKNYRMVSVFAVNNPLVRRDTV